MTTITKKTTLLAKLGPAITCFTTDESGTTDKASDSARAAWIKGSRLTLGTGDSVKVETFDPYSNAWTQKTDVTVNAAGCTAEKIALTFESALRPANATKVRATVTIGTQSAASNEVEFSA